MNNKKPKEPLLAVTLGLIFPTLGQVYAGRLKRAALFFIIFVLVSCGLIEYVLLPDTKIAAVVLIFYFAAVAFGLYLLIDAYFCAKAYNQRLGLERRISTGKRIGLICLLLLAFMFSLGLRGIYGLYIRANYVQAFKVPSKTMEPALMRGDRFFVDKSSEGRKAVSRGDVIVFIYPEDETRDFVKRLIAFGGEEVEIKDGMIFVDGISVEEPRIKRNKYFNKGEYGFGKITVPDGFVYVLGDNSASSHDSRFWGFVPIKNIKGRAIKIYWPMERSGPVE